MKCHACGHVSVDDLVYGPTVNQRLDALDAQVRALEKGITALEKRCDMKIGDLAIGLAKLIGERPRPDEKLEEQTFTRLPRDCGVRSPSSGFRCQSVAGHLDEHKATVWWPQEKKKS